VRTRLHESALKELETITRQRMAIPCNKILCKRYGISDPWLRKIMSRMRRQIQSKVSA